ncbi:ARM repeat-containing protein [Gautieria morchelliformis]|nr:ARM repeat-containing protein [Gautieria morchelliformis]
MESTNGIASGPQFTKEDEEVARRMKRMKLKELNAELQGDHVKALDSSLKRHTALIKRMRQSIGSDNRDQILKDVDSLSLEKYIEEIASAAVEGVGRCKTEKDIWSATEVISAFHRRFPGSFTPTVVSHLASTLAAPSRSALASLAPEQRDKEESARVARQRPVLRVCSELALVGLIRDAPKRSGGEWIMKTLKELLSNDPSLTSLPLLTTFLKYFSRPYMGLTPSAAKQISSASEPGSLSSSVEKEESTHPQPLNEDHELVEKDIRDRFKRMCEGYFDSVSKKLLVEHNRLQEQDRRNHEAYIRSGEIFEDRQQAYEKMTKGYEKLLTGCQTISDLLYLPMPSLPTAAQKNESVLLLSASSGGQLDSEDTSFPTGGKWEDEEERRFYEDLQDLRDFVPKSVLGLDNNDKKGEQSKEEMATVDQAAKERERKEVEQAEIQMLEKEIEGLGLNGVDKMPNGTIESTNVEDEENAPTPTASPPGTPTPPATPTLTAPGPSQLLTALLTRLPDATNRTLIDQAAVDFAFLNSKAARKRLVKFLGQAPKNRIDLLPHYGRLIATLNKYMADIGSDIVAILDEEFRYLQKKKNVVNELAETRLKNMTFIAVLTKFRVFPSHLILHIFKVCLDNFSGVNVDNVALLLEGCGRFLLRSEDTGARFKTMIELMRRKQSMQHFDQRQLLLLENAYYQCNPPERSPLEEKQRSPMVLFIRHLIYDVLVKKTIDKVLRLIRKLDWDNEETSHALHNVFTKPWKVKYSSVNLLAMLTYDLQRYHPAFAVAVVDQVLEDIRRGLEQNVYKTNQRRIATMKYLGELYIYRLIGSSIIFDTLWSMVTFGHPEGRPLPGQPCPIDAPDDFFRIRLVCTLLDTCGMCFDRGTQKKKLDNFLTFFQLYTLCKGLLPMDVEFMLSDSLEAVRPQLVRFKTFEEAAFAVDDIITAVISQSAEGEDSGEDSGDEHDRREEDEDEDEAFGDEEAPHDRPASPDAPVVLSTNDTLGPSEEAETEFAKELAKMVSDSSSDSRKVDKRTALALWDTSALPGSIRKKRTDDADGPDSDQEEIMKFTLISKKGGKTQSRQLPIPATSALAVHTRSAQLQDKVEQQHLKQFVLDYEQREEIEEIKALERSKGIRIRFAT